MKNIEKIAKEIFAKSLTNISDTIQINLDGIDMQLSRHGEERKFRDKGEEINEREIINTTRKGIKAVIRDIANGEIEQRPKVHIHNKATDLNVVGHMMMQKGKDVFVVITIMRKKNFIPKSGTITYEV